MCPVAQLCPTLCNPLDYSPPDFSVHEILQARILEWVAIFSSRGSSRPRDQTWVSRIPGRHFNLWATKYILKLSNKKMIQLRNGWRIWTDIYREDVQMAKQTHEKWSTSLAIREMQIGTTLRPTGMGEMKKTDRKKCWWGCGEAGTLMLCWWENHLKWCGHLTKQFDSSW